MILWLSDGLTRVSKFQAVLTPTCDLWALSWDASFPLCGQSSCSRDQSLSLLQFPKASYTLTSFVAEADTVEGLSSLS